MSAACEKFASELALALYGFIFYIGIPVWARRPPQFTGNIGIGRAWSLKWDCRKTALQVKL